MAAGAEPQPLDNNVAVAAVVAVAVGQNSSQQRVAPLWWKARRAPTAAQSGSARNLEEAVRRKERVHMLKNQPLWKLLVED